MLAESRSVARALQFATSFVFVGLAAKLALEKK